MMGHALLALFTTLFRRVRASLGLVVDAQIAEDAQEMLFGADVHSSDTLVEHDVPEKFISFIQEAIPHAATLGSVSAGSVRFCL